MPEKATQAAKISVLHSAGLAKQAIADLTGASHQTVANQISALNTAAKKKLPKGKSSA
jgi:hypothetical protein